MPKDLSINTDAIVEYSVAMNFTAELLGELAKQLPGDVSLNQARILAAVLLSTSRHEVLEMRDIGAKLGLSKSTVSRNVAMLSDRGYGKKPGLGLLTHVEDKKDRRVKRVCLSRSGLTLGIHIGNALRTSLLEYKRPIVDYLQDRSSYISVLANVDRSSKLVVYKINCAYSQGLYRSIVLKMINNPDYQVFFNEVIDLTDAPVIDLDDQSIATAIDTVKATPISMKRQSLFLIGQGKKFRPVRAMQSAFENEGLSTIRIAKSLDDVRQHLELPDRWTLPRLEPLLTQ